MVCLNYTKHKTKSMYKHHKKPSVGQPQTALAKQLRKVMKYFLVVCSFLLGVTCVVCTRSSSDISLASLVHLHMTATTADVTLKGMESLEVRVRCCFLFQVVMTTGSRTAFDLRLTVPSVVTLRTVTSVVKVREFDRSKPNLIQYFRNV